MRERGKVEKKREGEISRQTKVEKKREGEISRQTGVGH